MMPYTDIGDLKLYWESRGEGPPLVLIMGFTANLDWWPATLVDEMAKTHRLILFDNRASGRTKGNSWRFSIDRAARDTLALMDALAIEKAPICGMSMGGMIAQRLAILAPERATHLILGCTLPGIWSGQTFSRSGIAMLGRRLLRRPRNRYSIMANILFGEYFLENGTVDLRQFRQMIMRARIGRLDRLWQLRGLISYDSWWRVNKIVQPTLILTGDDDRLVSPTNSLILKHRMKHARLITYPRCGHAFIGEVPDQVSRHILAFLRQTDPGDAARVMSVN